MQERLVQRTSWISKFFSNHIFTYYNKETERGDFKDDISSVIVYTFPYTKLDLAPSSSPRRESQ